MKLGHVGSKTRSLGQQATQVSDLGPLWPSCLKVFVLFGFRYFGFITKHPDQYRYACHVFLGEKSTRSVSEALG